VAKFPPLMDQRVLRPSESALALGVLTDMDLLRLKTLARLYARGLPPDVSWEDLLQEALTRVLVGTRRRRKEVPTVAFLAGVMRSLKAQHWRRVRALSGGAGRGAAGSAATRDMELADAAAVPERALIAEEALTAIRRLFASDAIALAIIEQLSQGLSALEICAALGISAREYDSARRRMRRTLLKQGLTCGEI